MNTRIISIILILLLVVGGLLYFSNQTKEVDEGEEDTSEIIEKEKQDESAVATSSEESVIEIEEIPLPFAQQTDIGTTVGGRTLTAYHYGNGDTELLFIGGIHGGYSWNTVLVARELMEYLESSTSTVPENIRVTIIPVLNPDGLAKIVGTDQKFSATDVPTSLEQTVPGRFNTNNVDLNRNFDCDWKEESTWQKRTVSGGSVAFSEPESKAVRDYVATNKPSAVIGWYSSVGGVFASNCHEGILPETLEITNLYASASGYKPYEEFNFYAITGDMVNWFASENIPAISVLLTTHEDVEWEKNKAGVEAVLKHYAN